MAKRARLAADAAAAKAAVRAAAEAEAKREAKAAKKRGTPDEAVAVADVVAEDDDVETVEAAGDDDDKPAPREYLSEARGHIDAALESLAGFPELAEAIRLAPNDRKLRAALDEVRGEKKETRGAE